MRMRRTNYYELFKSNEQDESLLLLEDGINYDNDGVLVDEGITSIRQAMKLLRECEEPHCQIEQFDGDYHLIATKHNGKITKFY